MAGLRLVASRGIATASRTIAAFALQSGHGWVCSVALATLCCGLALGGCAPRIVAADGPAETAPVKVVYVKAPTQMPPINPALLAPQPAPDCTFTAAVSTPPTPEEVRMKLDYEAQCYRQAESIVHTRLDDLQDAVRTSSGRR